MKKLLVILLLLNLIIAGFCASIEDLSTMDFSSQGQPFVDVIAKSAIDLSTMDYSFCGQPFVSFIEVEEEEAAEETNVFFIFPNY